MTLIKHCINKYKYIEISFYCHRVGQCKKNSSGDAYMRRWSMSSLVPAMAWRLNNTKATSKSTMTFLNLDSREQPAIVFFIFKFSLQKKISAIWSQGQWAKIAIRVYSSWGIDTRTGRSCQCDGPASTGGTADCHKDNPRCNTDSPVPSVLNFGVALIEMKTINESSIIVKQNINDITMSVLATIWWHAYPWGINTKREELFVWWPYIYRWHRRPSQRQSAVPQTTT